MKIVCPGCKGDRKILGIGMVKSYNCTHCGGTGYVYKLEDKEVDAFLSGEDDDKQDGRGKQECSGDNSPDAGGDSGGSLKGFHAARAKAIKAKEKKS